MKNANLVLSLFMGLLLLTNCGDNTSKNSEQENIYVIIDIKKIVGKTLPDVEKILGEAKNIEEVKGYPCENSDCQRAYFRNGRYEVIFKNSRADRITINNTSNLTDKDNAIQALGLAASEPSFKNPNTVIRWNNVEGINEISFFTDYILVQVTQTN